MLFVKTKQETVWWFLLLGGVWLRLSLAQLDQASPDFTRMRKCEDNLELDIFWTLFIIFISVSLPIFQLQNHCVPHIVVDGLMQEKEKLNELWLSSCLFRICFLDSTVAILD